MDSLERRRLSWEIACGTSKADAATLSDFQREFRDWYFAGSLPGVLATAVLLAVTEREVEDWNALHRLLANILQSAAIAANRLPGAAERHLAMVAEYLTPARKLGDRPSSN